MKKHEGTGQGAVGDRRTEETLARVLVDVRTTTARLQTLLDRLEGLTGDSRAEPAGAPGLAFVANVNGRRRPMTEEEAGALDPEAFDVFIDVTSGTLRTRVPGEPSPVRRMADTPLQAEDVNTLLVFIDHPNRFFSHENLPRFLANAGYLQPNTLAKRMGRIRKALQGGRRDGPFICRTSDAHFTVSQSGFAYYFDAVGVSYCVVAYAVEAGRNQG